MELTYVSKLKHIVPHDDCQGFDEGIGWDILKSVAPLMDMLGNLDERFTCVDVDVHRGCIRYE